MARLAASQNTSQSPGWAHLSNKYAMNYIGVVRRRSAMPASERDASKAGRTFGKAKTPKSVRSVAASDLAQTNSVPQPKGKEKS